MKLPRVRLGYAGHSRFAPWYIRLKRSERPSVSETGREPKRCWRLRRLEHAGGLRYFRARGYEIRLERWQRTRLPGPSVSLD